MRSKLFLLMLTLPTFLFCQTQSNSFYSAYGIGVPVNTHFGLVEGLSGTGIGLRLPFSINTKNPAALNSVQEPFTSILSTGFDMEFIQVRDESESGFTGGGGLTHLDLWLKLNSKWAINLGISPFSEVNYSIIAERFFEPEGRDYLVLYEGDGGITQFRLDQSYEILKNLNLGLSGFVYFGSITKS
ncbi:MAG: hypothetical protein AAFO07_27495, partial [Bacteroidota bacterium]